MSGAGPDADSRSEGGRNPRRVVRSANRTELLFAPKDPVGDGHHLELLVCFPGAIEGDLAGIAGEGGLAAGVRVVCRRRDRS
jgi:hypothetical protein